MAEAVVVGLRSRGYVVTVADAAFAPVADDVDLLVVGAPTRIMGLPDPGSRRQVEARGGSAPATGVAEWLDVLPAEQDYRAAAFDTITGMAFVSGLAAKGIEKRLRRHAIDVVARESLLVGPVQGPPADGELARAERRGAVLG
ncbi:flavodoxin/nitric oxide synthase [Micromonospora sp. NPDC049274]|uniref:flavodoxin/nitric oxide synthase n=1 Tax=Micromonospora sp. NPDC049274 TaxID=3154829 RepID=UPI003426C659